MTHSETPPRSWHFAICLLAVACFFLQTGFVYLDYPGGPTGPALSPQASEGLALWRQNNCQVCHQIHGFGGFLGPDLTNITARRPLEDWTDILTRGRKQMPAFDFDSEQRAAIMAFLAAMNQTGTSIPRFTTLRGGIDPGFLIRNYLTATGGTADDAVLRGEELIRDNACAKCHPPFDVGIQGAPDLTLASARRSPSYMRSVILESKGAMPSHEYLTAEEVDDMIACMEWMGRNREPMGRFYSKLENGEKPSWSTLPWFEY